MPIVQTKSNEAKIYDIFLNGGVSITDVDLSEEHIEDIQRAINLNVTTEITLSGKQVIINSSQIVLIQEK